MPAYVAGWVSRSAVRSNTCVHSSGSNWGKSPCRPAVFPTRPPTRTRRSRPAHLRSRPSELTASAWSLQEPRRRHHPAASEEDDGLSGAATLGHGPEQSDTRRAGRDCLTGGGAGRRTAFSRRRLAGGESREVPSLGDLPSRNAFADRQDCPSLSGVPPGSGVGGRGSATRHRMEALDTDRD